MIRSNRTWQANYTVRFAACLALSIFLIALVFNLPLHPRPKPANWRIVAAPNSEALGFLDIGADASPLLPITAKPSTDIETAVTTDEIPVEEEKLSDHTHVTEEVREVFELQKVDHMPVMDFVDEMPEIQGGLAAYYIHIEYPKEAIKRGIEGRLTLGFVVEPDGSTSNVHIMNSLHPLCDSAAVQALRQTSFIPGLHQGESRRVRMRLPVKFVLVSPDSAAAEAI